MVSMIDNDRLNKIARDILNPSSDLNTIAQNIIKDETKRDIILQDFLYWMAENRKKVEEAIEKKYFKYLFIRIIKINNNGSHSDYSRRWQIKDGLSIDSIQLRDNTNEYNLSKKVMIEYILDNRETFLKNFFEETIFKLYYEEGLSYRQIGEHLNIHFTTIHKRITEHIIPRIKEFLKTDKNDSIN